MPSLLATSRQFVSRYRKLNWALTDQALVSACNFLTGVCLARLLGVTEFGIYALVWSVVLFLNTIQFALVSAPLLALAAAVPHAERPDHDGAVCLQHIIVATTIAVLTYASGIVLDRIEPTWHVGPMLIPLVVVTWCYQTQDFTRRYFYSHTRPRAALVSDCVSYLGQLGLILMLYRWGRLSSISALWAVAGSSLAAVALSVILMEPIRFGLQQTLSAGRRHWDFGKWLLASSPLYAATNQPLLWTLGAVAGSGAVGTFVAGRNMLGVLHILYLGMDNFVLPAAAKQNARQGVPALVRFVKRISLIMTMPVTIVCVAMAVFPSQIAWLFYGDLLADNLLVIEACALAYFIAFFAKPFAYLLMTLGKTKRLTVVDGVLAAVSLTLGLSIVYAQQLRGLLLPVVVLNCLRVLLSWRSTRDVLGRGFSA